MFQLFSYFPTPPRGRGKPRAAIKNQNHRENFLLSSYVSQQSLLEYKAMNAERQRRIFVEPWSDSIHIASWRNDGFLYSFHDFSKNSAFREILIRTKFILHKIFFPMSVLSRSKISWMLFNLYKPASNHITVWQTGSFFFNQVFDLVSQWPHHGLQTGFFFIFFRLFFFFIFFFKHIFDRKCQWPYHGLTDWV